MMEAMATAPTEGPRDETGRSADERAPVLVAPAPEGSRGLEPWGLVPRLAVGVVAAVLALLALRLPLWEAKLFAPQYPDGLRLTAFGDRAEGDVNEISALNHYIGMRPFDTADFPEMVLWLPTILAVLVAIGVSVALGRRWPGRLARLFVWGVPIGVLADVQFRLYQYGHDLDPGAALRVDRFTPLVVGPTKVFNFSVLAWPGLGVLLLLLAAALLSFGPRAIGKVVPRVGSR